MIKLKGKMREMQRKKRRGWVGGGEPKNQFRHLDKPINDLNKSKKTEQTLKINLKPKVFPSLDLVF